MATSALDMSVQAQIVDLWRDLQKRRGLAAVRPKRSKSRSPTAQILIEAAMNWKHGLIRLWALTSILWLLVISYLASGVFFKTLPFQGDYQYVVQTKEMHWNIDWNKPYYEKCYAPGNGRFPDKFATIDDEQYIQQFDEGRKAGKLALIEFPDNSRLYMPEELTETDKNYLAKLFFEQRWYRYVWKMKSWIASAFGLPLLVLIFGIAIAWVSRGFKKPAI